MAELTPEQWAAALADRDLIGKALLLVSRAKGKIPVDLDFKAPKDWPNIEPPAVADDTWVGFARQNQGENILEDWRREGRALVNTIAALYLATETPPEVRLLVDERTQLEREWWDNRRNKRSRTKRNDEIHARLDVIEAELRRLGISPDG